MRSVSLIIATALVLSACSVGPTYETPQPRLPEQWHNAAAVAEPASTENSQWWLPFNDPVLNELIEQAKSNSPDVQIAALRVAESREQLSAATGARWPTLSANAGVQRQRQSEFGVNTRLIDVVGTPNRDQIITALSEPFDVYQAGFDAGWEIDLWGRVRRSVESADASLAATQEDLHAAQLSLIAEVTRTYLQLRGIQQQLRIANDDVAAGTDELELTQYRVKGGVLTDLDLSVQRARLSEVRAQIPTLQQNETQLRSALGVLLGLDPGVLDQQLSTAAAPVTPVFASNAVPSEAARHRPDIRRAEAHLHSATAEIGVAVADLYPRISLTGSFVQQSLNASDFTEWGARQWVIGPSISLPIFDGHRRRSTVEVRKLQQQEALVNYQRTVLNAWHEIENSLSAYSNERKRNTELQSALNDSRSAYEVVHIRYVHGLTNYLADLDAHRTLLQAERAYSESNTQVATQLVALYKAMGGGWEEKGKVDS